MCRKCVCCLLGVIVTFTALVAVGCGKKAPPQPAEKAERMVEVFLDAWSRGEPADKFSDAENPIQGTDPDWKAGYRLLSFLSADAKQNENQPDHILCRVSLYLQDKKGKKQEKTVVYDVQLGEKSVIHRAAR